VKKSKTWTWLSCDHPLSLLQVSLTLGLSELTLCANVAWWNSLTFYLCVYMYEIAEENSRHWKVTRKTKTNTTHINGVITLWVSLTKYQTITFIMMSWSAAMTPHTDFISSQSWVQINIKKICQKFHANHYTNICILSFQYILEAIERPNHDAG
jgi:hypothetical protein